MRHEQYTAAYEGLKRRAQYNIEPAVRSSTRRLKVAHNVTLNQHAESQQELLEHTHQPNHVLALLEQGLVIFFPLSKPGVGL